jgi:hypothetical protein
MKPEVFVMTDFLSIVLKWHALNYMVIVMLKPTYNNNRVIMLDSGLMMYSVMEMRSHYSNVLTQIGEPIIVIAKIVVLCYIVQHKYP